MGFCFQAEDGIRDLTVTGVQTCALPIFRPAALVFSKLDVWPELTLAAAQRGVKLGLISATVAPHSSRLRWPARGWAEPAYRALERIGTISEEDGRRSEEHTSEPQSQSNLVCRLLLEKKDASKLAGWTDHKCPSLAQSFQRMS